MPQASVLTRTWPGPGSRSSITSQTSFPSRRTTARMVVLPVVFATVGDDAGATPEGASADLIDDLADGLEHAVRVLGLQRRRLGVAPADHAGGQADLAGGVDVADFVADADGLAG